MPRWQRRQLALVGTRRSRLGTVVGMIGGALVALGTFLPWLEFNGRVRSGWEIYEVVSTLGTNPAVISPMFGGGGYDIFFTGLVTLPLGMLTVLVTAGVLIANRKASPKRVIARVVLVVSATLAIASALVITVINLRTARMGTQGSGQALVHFGLWIAFAGGWAGTLGMAVSISGKRWRAQERWELETAAAAQEQQVSVSPEPAQPGSTASTASTASAAPIPTDEWRPTDESRSTGRHPARTFTILFLLVGLGGFVVAAATDQSVEKSAVADERAFNQRDPVLAAQRLDILIKPIKGAYDDYAAASLAVASAREDVTNLLTQAASTSGAGRVRAARAREELPTAIAAHSEAVTLERATRQIYVDQLAGLMKEMHR